MRMSSYSPPSNEDLRARYRERWEAVETIRARELAAMTEEQARRILFSLRLFAHTPADPNNGMGLVEQQAVFHRRRS